MTTSNMQKDEPGYHKFKKTWGYSAILSQNTANNNNKITDL